MKGRECQTQDFGMTLKDLHCALFTKIPFRWLYTRGYNEMHEIMLTCSTNSEANHSFQIQNWNIWTDNGIKL